MLNFVTRLLFFVSFVNIGCFAAAAQNGNSERLAQENLFPFLFNGRPSGELPNGAGYVEAIARFPDLAACRGHLTGSAPLTRQMVTPRIDWKITRTTADVEVCIFRALTAIRNIERGRDWLQAQGFQVHGAHDYGARLTIKGSSTAKWKTYAAEINKLKFREVFGVRIDPLRFHALRGISLQVSLDELANPKAVQLSLNFE